MRAATGVAVGVRVAVAVGAAATRGLAGTVGDIGGLGCGAGRHAANTMRTIVLMTRMCKDLFIAILFGLKMLRKEICERPRRCRNYSIILTFQWVCIGLATAYFFIASRGACNVALSRMMKSPF